MFEKILKFLTPHKDNAQKRWLRLYIDTTWRCNINCRICLRCAFDAQPFLRDSMSIETFNKIAQEVFPHTNHLSLSCNSEPLMSEIFPEALDRVSKSAIPLVDYATNAVLLNEDVIRRTIDAGIDLIHVSVDSADKETFERIRTGAKFDRVVGNLGKLRDIKARLGVDKPAVRFSSVLMRSTIEGIEDLMRLAKRLGAEGIIFRHLIPFRTLALGRESLYFHTDLARRHIESAKQLAAELDFKILYWPEEFADDPERLKQKKLPCGLPHTLFITSNGNVLCCEAYMLDVIGNIAEKSFDEIWNKPEFVKLREDFQSGKIPESCHRCPAVVSGIFANPEAFENYISTADEVVVSFLESHTPFDESVARTCNAHFKRLVRIKLEYDLFSGDGVTPEKLELWRQWYEKSTAIVDNYKQSPL